MQLYSNQPAHLYGIAKTHEFETLEDITAANMNFPPITNQNGTFTYDWNVYINKMMRKICHMMLSHYLQICL